MPLDNKLGKMYHRGASGQARLQAEFKDDQKIDATISDTLPSCMIKTLNGHCDKQGMIKYRAEINADLQFNFPLSWKQKNLKISQGTPVDS